MVHVLGLLVLAGLVSAQLPPGTCPPGSGKNFFRCASTGFNGCCSVDACSLPAGKWCPDYQPWTYTPISGGTPPGPSPSPSPIVPPPSPGSCLAGTGSFFKCASNGFSGCCTVDACNIPQNGWCPDYQPWTYTPKPKAPPAPNVPPPSPGSCSTGTGSFFKCASNGFSGCCTVDACNIPSNGWCPDYNPWTYTPKPKPAPAPSINCPAGTSFFKCASNGFSGCCTVDACNVPQNGWCPDYNPWTYTPKPKPAPAPVPATNCPAGKSFFKCASTGFNGCCSVDACQKPGAWCPDYDPWTYNPTKPAPPTSSQPPVACPAGSYPTCGSAILPPGTCSPGSGQSFYQCQANKFTGCCSQDACSMTTGPWCPDYKPWTFEPSGTYKCPDGSFPSCKANGAMKAPIVSITTSVRPNIPPTPSPNAPPPYVQPPPPAFGSCPKACLVHYNSCDKTTAPTCIFPDPYVANPRGACACRPGYKASYVADGDTTKQWRLPVVGQESRVWVAEGVVCGTLCKNPYGVNSCTEVKELGKECIG